MVVHFKQLILTFFDFPVSFSLYRFLSIVGLADELRHGNNQTYFEDTRRVKQITNILKPSFITAVICTDTCDGEQNMLEIRHTSIKLNGN